MASTAADLEKLQEAFYNFDHKKCFSLHIDDLRTIVTDDGEPMDDVRFFPALFFCAAPCGV
jgi:Ca2+-binding EF-hand superfamily protein